MLRGLEMIKPKYNSNAVKLVNRRIKTGHYAREGLVRMFYFMFFTCFHYEIVQIAGKLGTSVPVIVPRNTWTNENTDIKEKLQMNFLHKHMSTDRFQTLSSHNSI